MMNLLESTRQALDFTLRLDAALTLGDLDLCREILELRGQAMDGFEAAHRAATDAEVQACRADIADLAQADGLVRQKTAAGLESVAREFRQNMVSNRQSAVGSYDGGGRQACIDRKA